MTFLFWWIWTNLKCWEERQKGFLTRYYSPVCLTEMSDSLPTVPLTCGPDEENIYGTCKSEESRWFYGLRLSPCVRSNAQTTRRSRSCHVVRNASSAPSLLLLMSWACVLVLAWPRLRGDGPQPGHELCWGDGKKKGTSFRNRWKFSGH